MRGGEGGGLVRRGEGEGGGSSEARRGGGGLVRRGEGEGGGV